MIVQYRGYWVSGSYIFDTQGSQAVGSICTPARADSIVEVKRIEGRLCKNRVEAEEHGLMLAKGWLDGLAELFDLWVALRPTEQA